MRLFLTCWLVYGLHFATNVVREIYPALSLGDHLSFDVTEYLGLHGDIFSLPGRGAYINNNPGASILGAVPYLLARPGIDYVVARVRQARASSSQPPPHYDTLYPLAQEFYRNAYRRGLDVKLGLAAGVMQFFLMAPLSALSAVVMFYLLAHLTHSVRTGFWLALLYAFATPVFYRTAQLNQNLLISHCALFAFVLLWRPRDDPARPGVPNFFLAGLLCGWAVVLDYSGLVVVAVLGGYALARWQALPAGFKSPGGLAQFALGLGLCAGILMSYQWAAFGNPLIPAQRYMPPTRYSVEGYFGMTAPQLDLLWDTAFGIRFGLFASAPLLLLALYVPGWAGRQRLVGARETWCIIAMTAVFFLFAAANQFGRLQFNSGVRYVVPVTPFLFLLAASVLLRLPRRLAAAAGLVGAYWSWCLAMYRDVEQGLGVFEALRHITLEGLRLPWLTTLKNLGYLTTDSALPVLIAGLVIVWLVWKVRFPAEIGPAAGDSRP